MLGAFIWLLDTVVGIILTVVIANAIFSWLVVFNVINLRNPTMYRIYSALEAITDPLLRPIRRFLPSLGGMDLSPLVLILLLMFVQRLIHGALGYPM
jgi:YggT family protein